MSDVLKKQLVKHLEGGEAFTPLYQFLEEVVYDKVGERPYGLPYSIYELFYHITYAQKDILDFCTAAHYKTPNWPEDYWPTEQAPADQKAWEELKASYFKDRKALANYTLDSNTDVFSTVKHGDSQTLLRELLLVIEHSAYHTGQLLILLRLQGLHA